MRSTTTGSVGPKPTLELPSDVGGFLSLFFYSCQSKISLHGDIITDWPLCSSPPPRFEEGRPYIKLWRVGEFHQYLYSLGNHGALDHFLPVTCQVMTATTSLFSKLGKRKLLSLHLVVTNIYITRQQFSDWLHLITVILQTDIRDKGHKSMLSGSP